MSSLDLFSWAEQHTPAITVIDFRARREHLARWRWLQEHKPFAHLDRVIDRQSGRLPPAAIVSFPGSRLQPHTRSGAGLEIEDDARVG